MKNNKSIIVFLCFMISGTFLFAQNERSIPIKKLPAKDSRNMVSKPLRAQNGRSLTEKKSYTKEVFDINSVVKIKSSHEFNKIKQQAIDNSKSAKGIETILTEGFESTFPGSTWDVYASVGYTDAYWIDTDYDSYSGSWSGFCAGNGTEGVSPGVTNYPINMKAWMIFGPFDLSNATAATLTFKNWLDTEVDYDYFKWMASTDGINFSGEKISGYSNGWVDRSLDFKNIFSLGDLTGKPEVWIAFLFTSDDNTNYEGSYIDDIVLEKTTASSDLTWTNMALSATAWAVGGTITADLTESNGGTGTAGAHSTKLYLSTDNVITSADIQLGTDLVYTAINAGSTQIQSKSFVVPEAANGTYYVGAIVDFYDAVVESDETNNANYRTGQVTISHAASCPAPLITSITQTTCSVATGSVSLSGLPSTGTWTLTRSPGTVTTTGTGTSTTITGLAAGTYNYTVTNASACTSPSSALIVINAQPVVPPAPVANNAANLSSTSFTATWTGLTSATGYMIDVATNNGFTTFVSGYNNKNVGNVTTSDLTGLSPSTPYYYRVRAFSSCGNSSNSNIITATTLQNPPLPPVANQATAVTQTAFTVSWNITATATAYLLDVATDEGFTTFITGYNDKDVGNVTTFNVTSLSPGKIYFYRVRARNSGGASESSNTISSTTLFYPPLSPEISTVSGTLQTKFSLSWNNVETAAGYKLDVSVNNGFTTFVPGYNDKDVGNITTTDISGLSAKTAYYCRVRAYNSGGTSPSSTIKAVTTLTIPPPVPIGLTLLSCNNQVTLKWRKIVGPDFKRYRIFSGTSSNPVTKIDSSSTSSTDTVKIISGLTRGLTYYFRVTAVNYDGAQSDFSEQSMTIVKTGVIPKVKTKWNDVLICYNLGDSVKSYQWFNGTAAISGETKQFYQTNKRSGAYHVEIIDLFGCKNSSAAVSISGTGNISVYPNPSSGSFALMVTDHPEGGEARITIVNSSGIIVSESQAKLTDNMLFKEIHLNKIDEGIYLVMVRINDAIYYSRLVIAR
jgi:hypothetical protein